MRRPHTHTVNMAACPLRLYSFVLLIAHFSGFKAVEEAKAQKINGMFLPKPLSFLWTMMCFSSQISVSGGLTGFFLFLTPFGVAHRSLEGEQHVSLYSSVISTGCF